MNTITAETKTIADLYQANGWRFQIHGYGGLLKEPVEKYGWTYNPADQDDTVPPFEAMQRVWKLQNSGVEILGFVIAHEHKAPVQEYLPVQLPKTKVETSNDWGEVIKWLVILGFIIMFLPLAALMWVCATGDPILIAILNDETQTWIEILRWDD